MAAATAPGRGLGSAGSGRRHSDVARRAVGLSALSAAALAASGATFAVAYAVGGAGATEDNWVAGLVVSLAFVGFVGSPIGFALAIVAKARHERWTLLWLPLCVLPAFLLFLVLGEAFWWE